MRAGLRDHALSRGERGRPEGPCAAELPHRASAEAEAPTAGGACSGGPSAIITQASAITSTCRRMSCALMSARRSGGAISNSPSTAIRGTGRSPGTSTRPRPKRAGRASRASWRAAAAPMSTITRSILEGGALAVDFLGRYEDLDADLAKALRLIGVARRLDVPKSNVTPNKETRQDYRSYYTPRDRGAGARLVRARDRALEIRAF